MKFLGPIARTIVRWRKFVVAFWIVLAIALTMLLPDVKQANTGSLGDLVANDAEAIETEVRSVELFSFPLLSRTIIVERNRDGFSRDRIGETYERAAQIGLQEIPGVEGIAFALAFTDNALEGVVRGDSKAALTYLFFPQEIGPVGRTGLAQRLIDRDVDRPQGTQVGLTGAVPARGEQISRITDALPLVELATVLLVTLAVGLHFGAVVAPLANVLAIAIAYLVSLRLVGSIGSIVGISVPEEAEPVLVALLFGIVTDYSIFFLSRFRSHLGKRTSPLRAAEWTTAELIPIIFTAGISVAAASAALVVARLGFFQAFGPGLALAVLIATAVVLTLVPALLALLGETMFWPRGVSPSTETSTSTEGRLAAISAPLRRLRRRVARLRGRLQSLPVRKPIAAALAVSIPLVLLAAAVPRLELANTLISGLPSDSPTKQAYQLAASEFPAGAISPLMVLVEEPDIVERRAALVDLERRLERRKGFTEVLGPAELGADAAELGAVRSPTGDAVRYLIVLNRNPFGARAIELADRLQRQLPTLLERSGLGTAKAALAGDTAISLETVQKTKADLGRIIPAASLVVFLILVVFLRALVAPLYLVLASLLGLIAALGLTVLVFQSLLGFGELTFYTPFAGIVLLIALGSDYNVYLVGRVWAEARDRPLKKAVEVAGSRAASAIAVAGIVLALSFALLAIVPLRPFRELAFLLASGLLIDAFLIRTFLVPALITLVGERSGWPGGRLRRVQVPGQADDQ